MTAGERAVALSGTIRNQTVTFEDDPAIASA